MKGLFSFSGLLGLLVMAALSNSVALAQSGGSDVQKMMLYESTKKNQTTAVLLSCCISSAGHAYAGNWQRGLAFTAGRIGCGVIAVAFGIEEKTERSSSGYYYIEETTLEITPAYYIGYAGAMIIAIWEMVDASNEVKKYNLEIFRQIYSDPSSESTPKIGFNVTPVEKGGKVTLSYNF